MPYRARDLLRAVGLETSWLLRTPHDGGAGDYRVQPGSAQPRFSQSLVDLLVRCCFGLGLRQHVSQADRLAALAFAFIGRFHERVDAPATRPRLTGDFAGVEETHDLNDQRAIALVFSQRHDLLAGERRAAVAFRFRFAGGRRKLCRSGLQLPCADGEVGVIRGNARDRFAARCPLTVNSDSMPWMPYQ